VRITTTESPAIAPVTTLTTSVPGHANGWFRKDVTLTFTATDNDGGSGVDTITWWADGAQPIEATTVRGTLAQVTIATEGITTVYYAAKDADGNVEATKQKLIKLDKTLAETTVPSVSLAMAAQSPDGGTLLRVRWDGSDSGSGLKKFEVQASNDRGGSWTTLKLATPLQRSLRVPVSSDPTQYWSFRVRAYDVAGNVSGWARATDQFVRGYQEDAAEFAYSGSWTKVTTSTASGGTMMRASTKGATATFTTGGSQFSIISSLGPNMGKAEIWIDGTRVKTVDLYSSTTKARQVIYAVTDLPGMRHAIEVRVLGTKNAASTGTRVHIDAMTVLP
jgi:hypothetical protein